ncbi:MAG: aminotransferase class III-fold pyridoxal phosphate-dependent enzyme [Actinomycetota bacterium]|nr:aminotransferase class III-fold pyridoxal phosphate-dependent enzyme [Actinomycetota bacterium]
METDSVEAAYAKSFASVKDVHRRALSVMAGGTTHDSWRLQPFPIPFVEGRGAYKWDTHGRRFIDYWMGHGSLLQGHGYEPVLSAVRDQLLLGTHLGGLHPLQIEWASIVCDLAPSAERVRFVSSGTEATMLAIRVARAFTGRSRILRFDGHFHGWHDEAMSHLVPSRRAGLNQNLEATTIVASEYDRFDVEQVLESQEVAAVILEPGGGSSGALPFDVEWLRWLRRATSRVGTLLIFDEVVSGFRYAPGGAQQIAGVVPDLTTLAKILSGGLPGGAVCGSNAVMDVFSELPGSVGAAVPHQGTFNANPLSAAAGIAMLNSVRDGAAQKQASTTARDIAALVNAAASDVGVDVSMFVQSSIYHILIGAHARGVETAPGPNAILAVRDQPARYTLLRKALLLEGVDCHPVHGWVSTAHGEALEPTAEAFRRAFRRLVKDPAWGWRR